MSNPEPTASPLIGHDDSHFTPVALNGTPAPQQPEDAKALSAIELLSGKPIPPPAGKKTLAQVAEEIFAEGVE